MFLRGTFEGKSVENVGENYVGPWLEAVRRIAPQSVMIYTIDRETPAHELLKATPAELDAIAERVRQMGIACSVAY